MQDDFSCGARRRPPQSTPSRRTRGLPRGLRRRAVACLTGLVGLSGLLGLAGAAWAQAPSAPAFSPELALKPCFLKGVSTTAQCGVLSRPLDPSDPRGVRIDVHVGVLPAVARNKKPDPVFFFAGGPGQSAIDLAGSVAGMLSRFGNQRDIVLIDQRGTGRSARLACEKQDPWRPMAEQTDPKLSIERLKRCPQSLQALPHGDVRHYTTTVAMADADAVRSALGAERINLVGASYGTRAVLEYLRQFPRRVRSAVIDGVAPPDMVLPVSFSMDNQAALDGLLQACSGDPRCAKRFPKLGDQLQGLLATLPKPILVRHPSSGAMESMVLTQDMVMGAIRSPLYVPTLTSLVPLSLSEAAAGRFDVLMALAGALSSRKGEALADGMHFAVVCAEDAPRIAAATEAPGANFGAGFAQMYREVCSAWPKAKVPEAFYQVPPSPAPVLVLSGSADPATPPRHGERVATLLGERARHVVVPNAGHGTMGLSCLREAIYKFVDGVDDAAKGASPAVAPEVDVACIQNLPRATVYVPPQQPNASNATVRSRP